MPASDPKPSAPARIAQAIRNDIEAGRLRDGQRLPSTRELAKEWQASPRTITEAMEILAKEGYVESQDRSGRIVTTPTAVTFALSSPLRPLRPRIVYVGGFPGSGKSEFARTLARATNWAILDKDTIARPLIEPALEDLGHSVNDRESDTYFDRLRPREYEALEGVINDNIAVGTSVIATAPYIKEFTSRAWLDQVTARGETYDADCTFVWVRCSIDTMLMYLKRRGAGRDNGKLADWDAYSAGLDMDFRPEVEHVVIDNDPDSPPLRTQAQQLIESFRRDSGQ
ncbi:MULTISPECIES: GntR family transcriptional regulator [Nocardia]|uniref:Regulatory GntR family protein n=1 Tax=Nocardia fluminea TaxID=134984 RepID=A0A2N3V6R0_9NOCA|nr:GntR family transcriptional regulator [Nocardia fluminea]PKV77313.1 regulatory GntR family protein [Nocardia fluminea]